MTQDAMSCNYYRHIMNIKILTKIIYLTIVFNEPNIYFIRCLVKSRSHWAATRSCVGILNHKFLIQLLFWADVFAIYTLFVGFNQFSDTKG